MAELKFTAEEIDAMTQVVQDKYGVSLLGHPDRVAALITDLAIAAMKPCKKCGTPLVPREVHEGGGLCPKHRIGKWCGRPCATYGRVPYTGCDVECRITTYGCEPIGRKLDEPTHGALVECTKHVWKVVSQRAQGMWCKCEKCGATKEETWD